MSTAVNSNFPRFSISFLIPLAALTTLTSSAAIKDLSKRARFDHFDPLRYDLPDNAVKVGPPNHDTECYPYFGKPTLADCDATLQSIWPLNPNGGFPVDPEALQVKEFLGPLASGTPGVPNYRVPRSWSYGSAGNCWPTFNKDMQCEAKRLSGDCIITLTEEHDLEGVDFDYAGVDKATFRDVVQVSADVIHDCLVNPNNPNEGPRTDGTELGGFQEFGEKNELTIYVYSVDSEFAQVFDQRMGCIRAASSQDSIGTRIHMCTPQAGGAAVADSDNESVCSSSADSISGPKAGLCKETCGGKKITIANVLYGLHQLGELVVKSCGDAIFEVGKGL